MGRKSNLSVYIGFDNGVSGTIGIISSDGSSHFILAKDYTKKEQDYTKKKKMVTRIDFEKLQNILDELVYNRNPRSVHVMLERPLVNPGKFQASLSAIRALESTLILLEMYQWSVTYVASTEWQKPMLPKGTKGAPALKKASMDLGIRLFPNHKEKLVKQGDGDGMLIAEHCRRFFSFKR